MKFFRSSGVWNREKEIVESSLNIGFSEREREGSNKEIKSERDFEAAKVVNNRFKKSFILSKMRKFYHSSYFSQPVVVSFFQAGFLYREGRTD